MYFVNLNKKQAQLSMFNDSILFFSQLKDDCFFFFFFEITERKSKVQPVWICIKNINNF